MNKYVSLDKRSKKAQREYHAKQRRTWGDLNPVTRSVPSGKTYNRKKEKQRLLRASGTCSATTEAKRRPARNSEMDLRPIFFCKNIYFCLTISYSENDKEEMRASGLAEIAKVLQTTPNYLLGFADNNDGFADEALGLLRDVKDQSVREILLKQIRALI